MVKKKRKAGRRGGGNFWFRRREGNLKSRWGFIPINWKGWVALFLLVGLNVFSAYYFDVMNVPFKEVSRFLVVFLLSIFVFAMIARRRTDLGREEIDGRR